MEEVEPEYYLSYALRVIEQIAQGKKGTDEIADVKKALKKLPLVQRSCLVWRASGHERVWIAKALFGRTDTDAMLSVSDFTYSGELRLMLALNGGETV